MGGTKRDNIIKTQMWICRMEQFLCKYFNLTKQKCLKIWKVSKLPRNCWMGGQKIEIMTWEKSQSSNEPELERSHIRSLVCRSSKVHSHVRWLAQIRVALKLRAKTINCNKLIERGRITAPLSLLFLSSQLLAQHAFLWKARIGQYAGRRRRTLACCTSKTCTRTRRNTPEVKRPTKKQTPPFVLRAGGLIRERSEGRGLCEWVDIERAAMFAPSDTLSGICDTERTGGCQSAEAWSPGNVTVAGLGRWHGIANHLLLIGSSGQRDTYWRWRVAAQVWKAFESTWKEIFHELQPQCLSFHLQTQLNVFKGIKMSSKKVGTSRTRRLKNTK